MRNIKSILAIVVMLFNGLFVFSQSYFQQEVNYKIEVQLDDKNHTLQAFEQIEYINNSPHELEFIYFHLWPNAYKNGETALAKQKGSNNKWFYDQKTNGYIDSLNFKIDGQLAKWEYDKDHIDICKLILNQPLKPGAKIIITTPFFVKIPSSFISRLGHGGQSYQITQWYPKPAVYDRYGWHQFPYLNMGEFYSEFGSFDVKITLPKNYVVGATGDLQNPEEIEWLNELAQKTTEIKEFTKEDDYSFPKSDSILKTIQYKQINVHDFAWFADKRFHVLKGERIMPHTGRTVTCWAMFLNKEAHLWQRSIEYIGDALHYYSLWYGDYPYNHATAVHSSISAGGGMEYPNITVIGNSKKDMPLEMVIMHEVGHNWFYGILGFNEREFPWQDEGINSFSEARYMREKYKNDDRLYKMFLTEKQAKLLNIEDLPYKTFHKVSYLMSARFNIDQPSSLHSEEFSSNNYGQIVYHKTAMIFDHLLFYLGEEKFNSIMQNFYKEWKFKHPYPDDIRKAFEKGSGKDLSWFFDDLLTTNKKIDYKITGLKKDQLIIKNKGLINAPFPVTGFKDNTKVFTQWYDGFDGKKTLSLPENKDFDKIILNSEYEMPEMFTYNNYIRKNGLFRKIEPLHFQLVGVAEKSEKSNIYLLPAMGWNQYNNYMLGLLFYNSFIPRNNFEYQIIPMYGFGNQNIAGSVNFEYHILPYESIFREVTVGLSGKRYAFSNASDDNFEKIKAEIIFHFRKKDPKSTISNNIIVGTTVVSD
ncbi:MAG: M1 family metallopeptidase, partial [Bacteroidales bacterium]